MPIYTYYCLACDQDQEQHKKIADRDNAFCPNCGNRVVRGVDKPGLVWAPTAGGMRT